MPLALTPDHYDAWLVPAHADPGELRALPGQLADGYLQGRPVSTTVNNGPQLLDDVDVARDVAGRWRHPVRLHRLRPDVPTGDVASFGDNG